MNINDVISSQHRESKRLAELIEREMDRRPEVEAAFATADQGECLPLARKFSDAKFAHSPLAYQYQGELIAARARRDHIMGGYRDYLEQLRRRVEEINGPRVHAFAEECLQRVRDLAKARNVQRDETFYDMEGNKRVRIFHNLTALNKARDAYLHAMHDVKALLHKSLSTIEARIAEHRETFAQTEINTLEAQLMSADSVGELMPPQLDKSDNKQSGWFVGRPGRTTVVMAQPVGDDRLNDLSNRISKLERH